MKERKRRRKTEKKETRYGGEGCKETTRESVETERQVEEREREQERTCSAQRMNMRERERGNHQCSERK